jgi:ribosomal protein S18 acetylase RimI-like enzyme
VAFALPGSLAREGFFLRPASESDRAFQRALFGTARPDAQFLAAWPAEQREPFLDSQFHFQSIHYAQHHAGADFLILEQGGVAIGRLILDRTGRDWCVVDIALAPQTRGQGIGTKVLLAVQDAARAAGAAGIELSVEIMNGGAYALYARLGFVAGEDPDNGAHIPMRWRADALGGTR